MPPPWTTSLPRTLLRVCLLQDTPGLDYCHPSACILDHITAKNAAYLAHEQDPQRRVPMSAVEDMRVDACLFFINPNNLKAEEVAVMTQLAALVPIVPMVAKVGSQLPSWAEMHSEFFIK